MAGVDGIWKELTDNVNTMADNLTNQVRDIAQVSKSVARGDLTKKVTVEVRGEMLDLKNTINTMVDQVRFRPHKRPRPPPARLSPLLVVLK